MFSTKDMTHIRRSKGKKGVSVSFTPDMILTMSKEAFLHVPSNKQQLISMIGEELKKHGCHIHHDRADADLQIVQRTIQLASMTDTVLVGDDTDLLVSR